MDLIVDLKIEYRWNVMTFTCHEDYESLKPYIAITDKDQEESDDDNVQQVDR